MAELADALDLGSSGNTVGVQVPSPAPKKSVLFVRTDFLFHYCISTAYEVIFNIVNEINLNRQVSYGKQA